MTHPPEPNPAEPADENDPGQPRVVAVEQVTTAGVRGLVAMSDLSTFFDESFRVLGRVIADQGVEIAGSAFGYYRGEITDTVDVTVGFPTDRPIEPAGSAEPGQLPGGRVARLVHAGSFDDLGEAWQRLASWIGAAGMTPAEEYWEVYLTEPSPEMDPADLRTELNWLLA